MCRSIYSERRFLGAEERHYALRETIDSRREYCREKREASRSRLSRHERYDRSCELLRSTRARARACISHARDYGFDVTIRTVSSPKKKRRIQRSQVHPRSMRLRDKHISRGRGFCSLIDRRSCGHFITLEVKALHRVSSCSRHKSDTVNIEYDLAEYSRTHSPLAGSRA